MLLTINFSQNHKIKSAVVKILKIFIKLSYVLFSASQLLSTNEIRELVMRSIYYVRRQNSGWNKKTLTCGLRTIKHYKSIKMNYFFACFLLSIERFIYGFLWQCPDKFTLISTYFNYSDQSEFIFALVYLCKLFNGFIFLSWYFEEFGFTIPPLTLPQALLAVTLFVFGQFMNIMVWYRIGRPGVCYADRFGKKLPWCTEFPYSVFSHPQYVGAISTFWGIFIPFWTKETWYKLPLLETVLYICSAHFWEHD